jgi:hypothetical protein
VHDLGDDLPASTAPIASADAPRLEQSATDETGSQSSRAAAPSAMAGSLPLDAERNVTARTLRASAEHLESLVEVAEPVEAGDVLVIDADRSGSMSLARTAADSAVFGVVMDKTEANDTQVPVALSGIVLCNVDARFGPIRAGDLLTTSTTPGHAMRAPNPRPGTIVGKALESLGAGTARIKVLVMLH